MKSPQFVPPCATGKKKCARTDQNSIRESGESSDFVGDDTLVTSGPSVQAWNTDTGQALWAISPRSNGAFMVRASPDNERLAVWTHSKQIEIWSLATREFERTLADQTSDNVTNMLWSPDSKHLACANHGGRFQAWEVETGESILPASFRTDHRGDIAWSPDSSELLLNDQNGQKQFWSIQNRSVIESFQTQGVGCIWLAKSNRLVAYRNDYDFIHVVDPANGSTKDVPGHTTKSPFGTSAMAFSPDESRMITTEGSNIWLYDWKYQKPTGVVTPIGSDSYVAISSNGEYAGPADLEQEVVFVVQEPERQTTYTAAEFSAKFGLEKRRNRLEMFGKGDTSDNATLERSVAEWVLSVGGQIRPENLSTVDDVTDLPTEPFVIMDVNLDGTAVTDDDLKKLESLGHLYSLTLNFTSVGDDGIAVLKGLGLRRLQLEGCTNVTSKGIERLGQQESITMLYLHGTAIDDDAISTLAANFPNLSNVAFGGTNVTRASVDDFLKFPRIEHLWLANTAITHDDVAPLREKFPNSKIYTTDTQRAIVQMVLDHGGKIFVQNGNMRGGINPTRLEELDGLDYAVTGIDLTDSSTLRDSDLKCLRWGELVRNVSLRGTAVTDAGIQHLAGRHSLRNLDVSETSVTPVGVAVFHEKSPECSVYDNDRAVAEWVLATGGSIGTDGRLGNSLPDVPFRLTTVHFSESSMNGSEFVERLAPLTAINSVIFTSCTEISTKDLLRVVSQPSVSELKITYSSGFSQSEVIAGLTDLALTSVTLYDINAHEAELLSKVSSLEYVALWGGELEVESYERFAAMPNLEEIWLENFGGVSNAEFRHLVESATIKSIEFTRCNQLGDFSNLKGVRSQITSLQFAGCPLTDDSLLHLGDLASLKFLRLGQTDVTAAGVAAFKQANPDCEVIFDEAPAVPEEFANRLPIISRLLAGEPMNAAATVTQPASLDGAVSWTVETSQCLDGVQACEFSPDGCYVAAASDMRTRIYDVATGQLVRVFMGERAATVRDVSWSPDSRFLVTNDNHQFKMIWDVETGQLLWTRYQGFGTHLVAWSPDGRKIAYPDNVPDGKGIVIFDLASDKISTQLLVGADVNDFCWSADSRHIATASRDNKVATFDAESGERVKDLIANGLADDYGYGPLSVQFSPDGQYLVFSHNGGISILALQGDEEPTTFAPKRVGQTLRWSPDSQIVYSIGPNYEGTVDAWQIDGRRNESIFEYGGSELWHGDISPDGSMIVCGGTRGVLRIWDTQTGRIIKTLSDVHNRVGTLSLSDDGKSLAVGNVYTSDRQRVIQLQPQVAELFGFEDEGPDSQFLDDSTIMTAGQLGGARRLPDGVRLWEIAPKTGNTRVLRVSPDRKQLAFVSDERRVEIWNLESRQHLRTFTEQTGQHVTDCKWSPDGKFFTCISDGGPILVWDVANGEQVFAPKVTVERKGGIAWSPDSQQLLISTGEARHKYLWDASTHELSEPVGFPGMPHDWLGSRCLWLPKSGDWVFYNWQGISAVNYAEKKVTLGPMGVPRRFHAIEFSADEDYFLASDGASIQCFDWPSGELRGTLTPLGNRFVLIDASGNFADTATTETELESSFVYVVQERDRQMTYSPSEFEAKYGRKNNSQQARVFGSSN